MSLLERYIFRRAALYCVSSLASLVLIVWIVQALQRIDIVRTSASAAGNIFWIALMLLPNLAAGVLPFAVLIGSIQALNALNGDSERAVIAAAGAPRWTVIKPVLYLGLAAAAAILINSHVIGPLAQKSFFTGLRGVNADAITLFLQPGRFERVQDGLVISIGNARGSQIDSLFISDRRDPQLDLTYFAKSAQIVQREGQSFLMLFDGQLHRQSKTDGSVSIIQFHTYAFDLADLQPSNGGDWIRTSERSTSDLLAPNPNDRDYQRRPYDFAKEIVQRFSDWLYPIAFALWALVVAGQPRTHRQSSGWTTGVGLCGALALKASGFVAISLINANAQPVWLVYALPIASIVSSAVLLVLNVDLARVAPLARLGDGLRRLGQRMRPSLAAADAGHGPGGRT
ncbi:LptF/LptG family permease [Mangrovibrevibacter kandeliae]|uniref:LptF/LptG family permease n=1 Tax=Mangrovibrevibacter kandeliae TaxID=2968473 RepID=UPI0021199AE7|nr:LptF/LptG family permease [Aurantimonas sp. CSK15Z-1]MCQ8781384.1 LptF/LptG family permease [Aurantimonas sp. CSK15Z-1]